MGEDFLNHRYSIAFGKITYKNVFAAPCAF
jgi:hypothetical protein